MCVNLYLGNVLLYKSELSAAAKNHKITDSDNFKIEF